MKRFFSMVLVCCLFCTLLAGCGSDAVNSAQAVNKFNEFEKAYNEAAPFVVHLDDASVAQYDKATALYKKVATARDNGFNGYEQDDVDELVTQMDAQIGVLKSLMYKPADTAKEKDKNEKTYKIRVHNKTELPLYSVVIKSGSGTNDVTVSLEDAFENGKMVTVELQAPQNEKFTVVCTDEDEKHISFDGDFYLRDNILVELLYEEEKYVLDVLSENEQAERDAENENKKV